MNKVLLLFLFATLFAYSNTATAQVNLKVAEVPGATSTWGVFAKVCDNILPSGSTVTGSGQVTFKFPAGMTIYGLTSHSGTWSQNATVANPSEAVGMTYVSIGFLADNPQIIYQPDSETLLFSFKLNGNAAGVPQLILNGIDPFDNLPNSVNSNPGNELTVLDFGVQPLAVYTYAGNYTGSGTICNQEPQDTTVIIDNPIDTTGGGGDTTVIDTTGGGGDTTVIDTTGGGGDTTVIDTTGGGGGDTTVIDTTGGGDTTQTTGVFDIQKELTYFTLYPTPAYEWVTIQFLAPEDKGGKLRLFTLNGVAIGTIDTGQKDQVRFNVSGLSSGLYLIKYERDGKTLQQQKFLKQ